MRRFFLAAAWASVERDLFATRFAGERPGYLYVSDDHMDAEFTVEGADAGSDFAIFHREIDTIRNLLRERIDGQTGH